jgi:hypothetical protein
MRRPKSKWLLMWGRRAHGVISRRAAAVARPQGRNYAWGTFGEGRPGGLYDGETSLMRTLIIVPIVHSREDMGSLASDSAQGLAEATRRGAAFWSALIERVESLGQDWNGVKVYQDGLPDTLPELVDRVVAKGPGRNYELLRWLLGCGSTVLGTEDPRLLVEEGTLLKAISDASGPTKSAAKAAYARRAPALLNERDTYIARRIDTTLGDGQTGLLFIGAAHEVDKHLPHDIAVRRLDSAP